MTRDELAKALEGGYIEQHEFSMLAKSLILQVSVLEQFGLSLFDIRFLRVSSLQWSDEATQSWERLQIMDMHVNEIPERSMSEEWEVWFSLWDQAELTIRCAKIELDGSPLR